jgi:hypothetical protein
MEARTASRADWAGPRRNTAKKRRLCVVPDGSRPRIAISPSVPNVPRSVHQAQDGAGVVSDIPKTIATDSDPQELDYRGWPLRQRLELLAFDARLAGVPQALLASLWEAIDHLPRSA